MGPKFAMRNKDGQTKPQRSGWWCWEDNQEQGCVQEPASMGLITASAKASAVSPAPHLVLLLRNEP